MSRHHGRAALRLSWRVCAGLLLLSALLYAGHAWRQQQVPLQPMLPTIFEHVDHAEIQCADCHHNWLDDTGSGTCYNCHKTDETVNREVEAMFHHFCWGCHVDERMQGEESGPLRSCAGCHPAQ